MILKEERELFLKEIRDIVIRKGIDFAPLEDLYQKARKKPKFLEDFVDELARILDEKKEEDDLLLHDTRQSRELADVKKSDFHTRSVNSDGSSIGIGDSSDRESPEISEVPSKAYTNPITAYHWSRKKEFLNRFKDKINQKHEEETQIKIPEFAIKRKLGTSVWAYYLDENEEGEFETLQMSLSTEPVRPEFDGLSYEDVLIKDYFEAENVLERKGRVSEPINLDTQPDLKMDDNLTGIGLDTARMGSDSTAIVIRQGIHVVDVQRFAKNDTMETSGYVVQAIHDWKPNFVNIETVGGLGAAVYDRLMELGLDSITNICGIETQSTDTRHEHLKAFNVRSEMFLLLQERFTQGLITLPPNDDELAEEIVHIRYKINSDGKIQISDNEGIKKRLGRSPDRAIALALAFYAPDVVGVY